MNDEEREREILRLLRVAETLLRVAQDRKLGVGYRRHASNESARYFSKAAWLDRERKPTS